MSGLDAFLRAAKAQGASDEFLVQLLREQGWPEAEIYAALGRQYEEATGVQIPPAPSRLESAREAFFHLLAFATLGAWIFATGSLWFVLIDSWFPDAAFASYGGWRWSRVSWEMASIIVAFPAFLYATRTILAELERNPDKAVSAVRRWLTNIALLITALIFIGDVVAFVASFLQGGLTVRFVLKCLTVLVLAGAVFLYYNRGSSQPAPAARLWNRGFAAAAAGAILLSLMLGLMQTGSPAEQRLRAEDRRRLQDLNFIASALSGAWTSTAELSARKLPRSLAELNVGTGASLSFVDPITSRPYEYIPEGGSQYRLCAVFATRTIGPAAGSQTPNWRHEKGRHCFALDASKLPAAVDLY